MFTLERLLRNLSGEQGKGTKFTSLISSYDEMLDKIEDWRNEKIIESEYHERLRWIILPQLKRSLSNLRDLIDIKSSLKIVLFAFDHKIELTRRDINWTCVTKELVEIDEKGLILRLVRYLRIRGKDEIEEISLLMMNTLIKMMQEFSSVNVSFSLQLLKLFPVKIFEDHPILETLLISQLQSNKLNDRIKLMAIKMLKEIFGKRKGDILELIKGEYVERSAILMAELCPSVSAPKSTSKMINFLNGHYDQFSPVEQAILRGKYSKNFQCSNEYEDFLCALEFKRNLNMIKDKKILRYLLRIGLITVEDFMEKAKVMETEDFELICEKSLDGNVVFECLKRIPVLKDDLKSKTINGLDLSNFDKEELKGLSFPAQWHFFKQLLLCDDANRRNEYQELARDLYEKYRNNFDGSGEIFKFLVNKNN